MIPSFGESFIGGIKTFFSVWQLCIFQVTPFYLAFLLAAFFFLKGREAKANFLTITVVALGLALGFSAVFSLAGVPTLEAGSTILRNLKTLRFFAGVFIISTGGLMAVLSFLARFGYRGHLMALLSPLAGGALAIAYSPCISPSLSSIMNYASIPGNGGHGLALLLVYGLGLCASLTGVGALLMLIFKLKGEPRKGTAVRPLMASLIFMIIGILLVSGMMMRYKMILVNIF